jgi:hypothetical protein
LHTITITKHTSQNVHCLIKKRGNCYNSKRVCIFLDWTNKGWRPVGNHIEVQVISMLGILIQRKPTHPLVENSDVYVYALNMT